ncbi:MAG: hypothetical protein HFE43_02960 [Oscillospiraceae bacterium]|jgi:hypothetical protein|nr:hypothetical protein [Oscillospiraceae bacterium]
MDETPRKLDGILLRDGALIYYGNPAGRLEGEGVTADSIFRRRELEEWLEGQGLPVQWEEGVYDGLCQERIPIFRIWQLRPEVPLRFPALAQLREAYGEPCPGCYRAVYAGERAGRSLEELWLDYCREPLEGAEHPLSISDVLELREPSGSSFFYIDRREMLPIPFADSGREGDG